MARTLRLSYMGVKSQCLKLERSGYLTSSLHRRGRGRPEVLYRITPKGRTLFPQGGTELSLSLLEQAARLFGPQAPQKLLFAYFQAQAGHYSSALKAANPAGRAEELAMLRSTEGRFARVESEGGLRYVEGHNPLGRLYEAFPEAEDFETAALAKALGCGLRREVGAAGESLYWLAVTGAAPGSTETVGSTPPHPPAAKAAPAAPPAEPEPETFRLVAE
jgi:predicted ArsR family transcriptional regulator